MREYKGVVVKVLPTIEPKREARTRSPKNPFSRLPTWELGDDPKDKNHPEHPSRVLKRAQWNLVFNELSHLDNGDTSLKRQIRQFLNSASVHHYDFSPIAFAKTYEHLTHKLDQMFGLKERRVSLDEMKFNEYLKFTLQSRRKFYQQFWIGRYNVDFWLPWARNQSTVSMIVEVCGGVYNDQIKQVKFGKKCKFIESELRIPIFAIDVVDATYAKAQEIVQDQLAKRALDSKTLKRLLHKIHIATLSAWINDVHGAYYSEHLGLTTNQLCKIRDIVLNEKKTTRFEKLNNINLLSTSMSKSEDF